MRSSRRTEGEFQGAAFERRVYAVGLAVFLLFVLQISERMSERGREMGQAFCKRKRKHVSVTKQCAREGCRDVEVGGN